MSKTLTMTLEANRKAAPATLAGLRSVLAIWWSATKVWCALCALPINVFIAFPISVPLEHRSNKSAPPACHRQSARYRHLGSPAIPARTRPGRTAARPCRCRAARLLPTDGIIVLLLFRPIRKKPRRNRRNRPKNVDCLISSTTPSDEAQAERTRSRPAASKALWITRQITPAEKDMHWCLKNVQMAESAESG
jgi:hypothetical protein